MDYSRFLTSTAQNRKPEKVRALGVKAITEAPEDNVYMAGGLPNPEGNPFVDASFTLVDGTTLKIDSEKMKASLQYFVNQQYDPLMEKISGIIKECHSPPLWQNTKIIPCIGALDGIARAFDVTLKEGDYILIQDPCYSAVISMLNAYQLKILSIDNDENGPKPDSLRTLLSKWKSNEMRKKEQGVPKILYLNPSAANPSGVTIPNEIRKEIYKIACEYNLLIFEDDAYYFVQFGERENWPQSFLSMDTEGRVVRFDSCSKIISAGLRLGFVTGPSEIVNAIKLHMEFSAQQPSSLTQVLVGELIISWGEKGFWKHIKSISKMYEKRMMATNTSANKYLKDLCEWKIPTGGMFLWVKVKGLRNTWSLAERCIKKGITIGPGSAFGADPEKPSSYIRLSYSLVNVDDLDKGFARLAECIEEELSEQKNSNEDNIKLRNMGDDGAKEFIYRLPYS